MWRGSCPRIHNNWTLSKPVYEPYKPQYVHVRARKRPALSQSKRGLVARSSPDCALYVAIPDSDEDELVNPSASLSYDLRLSEISEGWSESC